MKGDEKLWGILNDKLDMLRASNRLREAIRVAETALDLAQRAFKPGASNYTLSLEKLGQLYDQAAIGPPPNRILSKHMAFWKKPSHSTTVNFFVPPAGLDFSATISAKPMLPSGTTRLPLRLGPN